MIISKTAPFLNPISLSPKCPAIYTFIVLLIFLTTAPSLLNAQAMQTVPNVDLKKYAGKWYENASFPQRFQRNCHCTTAEYTLSDKGYVIVVNRCRKDSVTGREVSIKGKAFVVKGSSNSKLKVQFFWPIRGKYWIIDLANDYSYAVVSHPNKKYLWILCRIPKMDPKLYEQILEKLKNMGLDTGKLQLTPQVDETS
jgi:apolipoprotein D and lipocalin family protein